MEVLIVIIGLVISIVNAVNKANKVKDNAPGKASVPQTRPQPVRPPVNMPAAPTVRPAAAPARPTVQPAPTFWQEISASIQQEVKKPDQGHGPVSAMAEGVSRECEHGSVGGSMAYEGHQEGRNEERETGRSGKRAGNAYERTNEAAPLQRPSMNAQEMRRAIIMAEILKRPDERRAEQARRWSGR